MSDWKLFILKVKKPNEKIQKEKPKTKQNKIFGETHCLQNFQKKKKGILQQNSNFHKQNFKHNKSQCLKKKKKFFCYLIYIIIKYYKYISIINILVL